MIVSKAPLRITFNGGGSDLPRFFAIEDGLCTTATIDRYIYVTVNFSFDGKYRIAYSELEHVAEMDQIKHPLVRNTLKMMAWEGPGLEITSVADVPASGTGLGSSSAFTVALIGAIAKIQGKIISDYQCGKLAIEIEISLTGDPIGWQDQFAVADGGLIKQQFSQSDAVIESIFTDQKIENQFLTELNKKSMFFHIDKKRKANEILAHQNDMLENNSDGRKLTSDLVSLSKKSISAIENFDFEALGKLLMEGWRTKFQLNGDSIDSELLDLYQVIENSPAYGAKLMGAGGGGFLFVIADESYHLELSNLLKGYKLHDFQVLKNKRQVYDLGGRK